MKSSTPPTSAPENLAELGCAGIRVWQPTHGYRFSLDAYLLAAFVDEAPATEVFEVGYGSGVIALLLAAVKGLRVSGVEIQPRMVELARRSVALNGLEHAVELAQGDFREYRGGPHAAVVVNPPYRPLATGRLNPDESIAQSRHEISLSLEQLAAGAARCLRPGGRFYCIYPAWRLVDLMAQLRAVGLEPKRLRIVHSRADGPGRLCLVAAARGGGCELKLEPPLVIYGADGQYSDEARAIFAGLGQQKAIDR